MKHFTFRMKAVLFAVLSLLVVPVNSAVLEDDLPVPNVEITPDPAEGQSSIDVVQVKYVDISFVSFVAFDTGDWDLATVVVTQDNQTVSSGIMDWGEEDNVVEFRLEPALTSPGTYTVTIPSGAIQDSNTDVIYGELSFTYTITGLVSPTNVTVTPDPAESLESLSGEFRVVYNDYTGLYPTNGSFPVTVTGDNDYMEYFDGVCPMGTDNVLQFTIEEAISASGTYTVTIPGGALTGTNPAGKEELIGELSFSYTVEGKGQQLQNVRITPDPAEEQTVIDIITVEYLDASSVIPVGVSEDNPDLAYATVSKEGTDVTSGIIDWGSADNSVGIWLNETLVEPGTYQVTVPAGAVQNGETGDYYDELVFTYTIGASSSDVNATISPDPEGKLVSLSGEIRITYDDYTDIYPADGPFAVTVTDGIDYEGTFEASCPMGTTNVLLLTVGEEITAPGVYTITIPSGALIGTNLSTGKEEPIGTLAFSYTVGDVRYTVSVDPKEGVVESLREFMLTFNGATQIAFNEEAGPRDFPYYGTIDDSDNVVKIDQFSVTQPNGNSFGFYMPTEVTEAGRYAVIVPRTFYTVDGEEPEADLRFEYTIEGEVADLEYSVTFDPEEGDVNSLTTITVTFASEEAVSIVRDAYAFTSPNLYSADGSSTYRGTITGTGGTFVWSLYSGELAEGQYKFVIPADYITLTDASGHETKNKEIVVYYTLASPSSIDGLDIDGQRGDVYDLNGVLLLRNADVEAVKRLPEGLYIFGGKKMLVR